VRSLGVESSALFGLGSAIVFGMNKFLLKTNIKRFGVFLLSIMSTLLAENGFAERPSEKLNLCTNFKNIGYASLQRDVSVGCSGLKGFDDMISRMQMMSPTLIKLGYLIVGPRSLGRFATENWENSSVEIFYDSSDAQWNEGTRLIFPHEVGHLILDQYISSKFQVLNRLSAVRQRNALYMKHLIPILQMRQRDSSCGQPGSVCAQKIVELQKKSPIDLTGPSTTETMNQFYSENQAELQKIEEVLVPYHELFADLVQALYYDDPMINNKATLLMGVNTQLCRTFKLRMPRNFQSIDPHCQLSAIRRTLWNQFVVPQQNNKKAILGRLAEAISQEVARRVQSGQKITDEEAGLKLLQKLNIQELEF